MKTNLFCLVLCFCVCVASWGQDLPTITVPLELSERAIPLEMVLIPAGTFVMGTPRNDPERWLEEFTPHEVTISQPFFIARYEMTQQQWEGITENNPARYEGLNRPVENVSWERVEDVIEDLNELDLGLGTFRLPTEAEWELAYRAGTETRFYWGDDRSYQESRDYMWSLENFETGEHRRVGERLPNDFGLYDMAGNLYEYVQDDYVSGQHQDRDSLIDPLVENDPRRKVIKGGSYISNAHRGRASWRYFTIDTRRFFQYGFRLALTPEPNLLNALQTNVTEWQIHD